MSRPRSGANVLGNFPIRISFFVAILILPFLYNACSKTEFNAAPSLNIDDDLLIDQNSPSSEFKINGISGGADSFVDKAFLDLNSNPSISWQSNLRAQRYDIDIFEIDQKSVRCSNTFIPNNQSKNSVQESTVLSGCSLLAGQKYIANLSAVGSDTSPNELLENTSVEFTTSGFPTKTYDFRKSSPEDLIVERQSLARFYAPDGSLKPVDFDKIRLDHDPITGETLGALIEGERTNYMRFSQQFDNSMAWTRLSVNFTANATIGPEGSKTSEKIFENNSNGNHGIRQTINGLPINTDVTVSVYAKSEERKVLYISTNTTSTNHQSLVDIEIGEFITNPAPEHRNLKIVNVGNGWFRISVTYNTGNDGGPDFFAFLTTGANQQVNYQGDGVSGLYLYGAQVEVGGFASSYIQTSAAPLTKPADRMYTDKLDWYNTQAGSVSVQHTQDSAPLNADMAHIFSFSRGNTDTGLRYLVQPNIAESLFEIIGVNLDLQSSISSSNPFPSDKQTRSFSSSFRNDSVNTYVDGAQVGSDNNALLPPGIDHLTIGGKNGATGSGESFGHLKLFRYWNKQLSNQALEFLSRKFSIRGVSGGGDNAEDNTYSGGPGANPQISFDTVVGATGISAQILEEDKLTVRCSTSVLGNNIDSVVIPNCFLENGKSYWVDVHGVSNNLDISTPAINGLFRLLTPPAI